MRSDLQPTTWVPETQEAWKPGQTQSWEVVADLGHPALGLRAEQLTASFAPLGLSADWGAQVASQYALATHAFISLELGSMKTERDAWSPKMRTLVAVLMTERAPRPVPFRPFAETYHAFRDSKAWGWGTGRAGFRRTHERAMLTGGFPHMDAGLGSQSWSPVGPADFRALDRAWANAVTAGTGDAFIPLLPVEVCCCFAASRRRVVLGREHEPAGSVDPTNVPSLWELIAAVIHVGPEHMLAASHRWLALEAQRDAGTRGANRQHPERARGTLETAAGYLNGIFSRLEAIAPALSALSTWAVPVRVGIPEEVVRTNPARTEDRTAVPLPLYRRARSALRASADDHRNRTRRAEADRRPQRYTTQLRRLIQTDLLGQVGARPNEVLALTLNDVVEIHAFGDNLSSPAVWLTPSAKGSGTRIDPYWRPIALETFELIAEWRDWLELTGKDHLFAIGDKRTRPPTAVMSSDFAVGVIPDPRQPGASFAPMRVRHLAEALAYLVGVRWLEANDGWLERVCAQVFADAFLTHRMSQDKLGYKDLEADRKLWAARAALGDPANGVPGVIDLTMTDAGARRGWDISAIRQAVREMQAAEWRADEARRTQAAAQRQVRVLRDSLSQGLRGLAELSERQLMELSLRRDAVRLQIDEEGDRAADAREARAYAESAQNVARKELVAFQRVGRTLLLPDATPLAHETPVGDTPLDRETWDDALERAGVIRHSAADRAAPPVNWLARIRHYLNIPEFAAVCGVSERSVRSWLDEADTSPTRLPTSGPGSPVIRLSKRARVIAVDLLPRAFLDRLVPEQHELMEQLLMVPMGSSRWSGRSYDLKRIEAAARAQQALTR